MITDGALPAPDPVPAPAAIGLPVYADEAGMLWLRTGMDAYVPLNEQLVRAITEKWRSVTRAEAEAEVGPLAMMSSRYDHERKDPQ